MRCDVCCVCVVGAVRVLCVALCDVLCGMSCAARVACCVVCVCVLCDAWCVLWLRVMCVRAVYVVCRWVAWRVL